MFFVTNMSRYSRENPDEPPNHDWFATVRRLTDPRLCLRCGQNPKLPPLIWRGKVVAQPNLCRECDENTKPCTEKL